MTAAPAGTGPPDAAPEPICSAARCTNGATWRLTWANPKIHHGGRTKTWLACDEHRGFLSDFLARRGFLLDLGPFAADSGAAAPPAGPREDPRTGR